MADNTTRTSAPPRAETAPASDRPRLALSPLQVAASSLASVTAAIVASLLGVTGTLVGAAVASVIATVGSALYAAGLRHSRTQLALAQQRRQDAAGARTRAEGIPSDVFGAPVGMAAPPPPGGDATQMLHLPADLTRPAGTPRQRAAIPGGPGERRGGRRRPRRLPLLAGIAATFVAAIAVITIIEWGTGQTLASTVGGSNTGGISLDPRTTAPARPAPSSTTTTAASSTTSTVSTPNTTPAASTTSAATSTTSTTLGTTTTSAQPGSSTTTTLAPAAASTTAP